MKSNNVRRIFSRWSLGVLAVASFGVSAYARPMTVTTPSGFELKRGVNLSHWLSQNFGWSPRDTFVTEKDIAFIADSGYDHVRIPIDEVELWAADGRPSEASFAYLTRCLDWCGKHHLRAIVDLHILKAHHFNADNGEGKITLWTDPAAQDNFIRLWTDISARVKKYPVSQVAYELMNEPVAPDPEDWNRLIAKAMKALRKLEPDRVVIIGANRWQTPDNLPLLKVPANDRNIILSLHTYAPLFFTHHLANWTAFKNYTAPVHYPGRVTAEADLEQFTRTNPPGAELSQVISEAREVFDKQRLLKLLQPAIETAQKLNLPLYCGEFGCLPHVDREDRLRYYDDIISAFEQNQIAWCIWEYKGDFGIFKFDFEKNKVLEPDTQFIQVLMRKR